VLDSLFSVVIRTVQTELHVYWYPTSFTVLCWYQPVSSVIIHRVTTVSTSRQDFASALRTDEDISATNSSDNSDNLLAFFSYKITWHVNLFSCQFLVHYYLFSIPTFKSPRRVLCLLLRPTASLNKGKRGGRPCTCCHILGTLIISWHVPLFFLSVNVNVGDYQVYWYSTNTSFVTLISKKNIIRVTKSRGMRLMGYVTRVG
jgi:hypothetical protein